MQLAQLVLPLAVAASAQFTSLETIKSVSPQPPAFKAAAQNVFEYRLDNYPKEAGACLPAAREIAAQVERLTHARVVDSRCEDGENGYKITLTYEAPQALRTVTTAAMSFTQAGFGAYASLAACSAALEGEAAAFKEATGLEPAVKYCFKDPFARDGTWTVRVDGFGAARLMPDIRSALLFTYPQDWTKEGLLSHIEGKLKEQGVNVRSVSWHGDAGYASVNVSYYAKERIVLRAEEPFKTRTREQCAAQLAELDKLGRKPEPLIHYCGTSMIGGWELAWLYKDKPSLKTVKASESFASYEACLAGKDAVIRRYRESLGHAVLGAACSEEVLDDAWKVILLE